MKLPEHTTPAPIGPTLGEISRWHEHLRDLHAQLRPHFARPEAHQHALHYLQAVLSDIPRKNGWQIAEQARQARPYGIQRLLSTAAWDQDAVRDDLRALVCQSLTPSGRQAEGEAPFPVLVVDESGFPKRGCHSAGVGPQYCGLTGRVENCQVGVFLSYVTAAGHGLIDRELYLPEDWCSDLPRRHAFPLGGSRYRSQATVLTCEASWRSTASPTHWPCPPLRSSVCRPAQVSCSVMWPASPSRRSGCGSGSDSPKARAPKASASLTGLACPSCRLAPPTGAIGSSYAAAWTTPTS